MATTGICPSKKDSLLLVVVLVQLKTFASLAVSDTGRRRFARLPSRRRLLATARLPSGRLGLVTSRPRPT